MATDDPFAGLDDVDSSPSKKDQKKAERESRKRAKMDLTESLDDLDLEKKPANPYVLFIALALLLGAFVFSLKPVSISMTGEGVYAVQVDVALIGENLVQNECRPSGENQGLENSTVSLAVSNTKYNEKQLEAMALSDLKILAQEDNINSEGLSREKLIKALLGQSKISDYAVTQPLPFADAVVIGKACYFEVIFDGVLPTDGTTFDVGIQLPDRTFKETRKLDPQMKIGPIEFKVN